MNKVYMFFSFFALTVFWSIFLALNPSIILDSKEHNVEFYSPKISIGNNGRILYFKYEGKEYLVLCSYLTDGKENEFCDKRNININKIKGSYFETSFDKNRKTKDLIISEINYKEHDKNLDFIIPDFQQLKWKDSLDFTNKKLILFLLIGSYFVLFMHFLKNRLFR